MTGITEKRGQLSLYAVPTFLWFSTRLFAGIRTALNDIYDVSLRPERQRGFIMVFVLAKLRDAAMMVVGTVVLFLANTLLTTGLTILQARGAETVPQLGFFVSTLGRYLTELLAFSFSVSLFYVTYKYARCGGFPEDRVVAATFTALLFELAKRLYALYLTNFASLEGLGRREPGRHRALHSVGVLHRHRVPARRGCGRDLGAQENAG